MPFLELETTVKIHFEYWKEEPASRDYPGCPEHIQVNVVSIPGFVGFCVPQQKEEGKVEQWVWEAKDEWKEED